MPDIFISYAREDRAVAAVLANTLQRCGWSVWWDRIIPPGKTFDEVIEAELTAARCAIVLWSKPAIASRWVREEAQEAANRNKLVPAMLDGVEPPMGFRRIHAADLAGWRGDESHPGWHDLKGAIGDLLGESLRSDADVAAAKSCTLRGQPQDGSFVLAQGLPRAGATIIALFCGYSASVGLMVLYEWLGILKAYDHVKPVTLTLFFLVGLAISVKSLAMALKIRDVREGWRLAVLYALPVRFILFGLYDFS